MIPVESVKTVEDVQLGDLIWWGYRKNWSLVTSIDHVFNGDDELLVQIMGIWLTDHSPVLLFHTDPTDPFDALVSIYRAGKRIYHVKW